MKISQILDDASPHLLELMDAIGTPPDIPNAAFCIQSLAREICQNTLEHPNRIASHLLLRMAAIVLLVRADLVTPPCPSSTR